MPILVKLNVVMAERNAKSKDLAAYVGITEANLSLLKQGKVKGVRFETLERICEFLDCEPGDILRIDRKPRTKALDASVGED
jgi:putative transcriptional regulator